MSTARDKEVYFAKLAEQAERYDEMADHMEKVGKIQDELTVEERRRSETWELLEDRSLRKHNMLPIIKMIVTPLCG